LIHVWRASITFKLPDQLKANHLSAVFSAAFLSHGEPRFCEVVYRPRGWLLRSLSVYSATLGFTNGHIVSPGPAVAKMTLSGNRASLDVSGDQGLQQAAQISLGFFLYMGNYLPDDEIGNPTVRQGYYSAASLIHRSTLVT
jgi:hypothetical protein